jgi:hypothetical protein
MDRFEQEVERLYKELDGEPTGRICQFPVIGGSFVKGEDPVRREKRRAYLALVAREWFAKHAPPDAPPLPLSHREREDLKCGGLGHIVAWYARSLASRAYDFSRHPSFDDYACGVMASQYAPWFIAGNEQLRKRFPPRPLEGLGGSMYWEPPKRARARSKRSAVRTSH